MTALVRTLAVTSFLAAGTVGLGACSAQTFTPAPVNATGAFTIALTNDVNDCQLANWTQGNTSSGIPFDITQNGTSVVGKVGAGAGLVMAVWLGSAQFGGTVTGSDIVLTNLSNKPAKDGTCDYNTQAKITGTLNGDVITGNITYSYIPANGTGGSCGFRNTCTSVQKFNGTRPPTK